MAYLVPTIHPAAALRSGQQITDVIAADLGKAHRISQTGPELIEHIVWPLPGNPEGIVPSWEKALGWLRYWRATGARLGVDVETSALDYFNCKLYSIALGDAESHVGVAFTLCDFHTLPLQFEQALVNELRLILIDPMIEKVFHNAPFDMAVLHRKNLPVCGPILDTQGMHHLVQPDIPHSLGWVGQTYHDCGPWKFDHSSGKMANTNDPVELLIYNARDALYTAMLVEPLKRAIEQRGMSSTLISWQSAYAQLATDMEIAGLPVNIEKRRQMALTMREKKSAALYKMREFLSWPDFNPMADAHRREALFGDKYAQSPWNLGLTATKHTKKLGLPSTSFKSVIDNLEHPFVRAMADYVETQQVYATQYRDGTLKDEKGAWEEPGKYQRFLYEDGRIHPRWKSNTLNSVRYASEPNVQNQRVFDREFFEAPPGRCFIASDLDQLELRIAACRAGVGELLAEMARPDGDPHTLAARHVFGAEFDAREPKARKMLRDMTKNTVYASLYLAGIITVWRTIRERKQLDPALRAAMTLPVVRHIHKSYFMRYMEFPRWHEADLRFINTHGYLEIPPFGRRRYCPVLPAPATEFSNWKVQCYTKDMKIHTVEGLKKIIDCDNTMVTVPGRNGLSAPARLVPRGKANLISVQLADGSRPIHVSEKHQWLCQTEEGYTYQQAAELRPGSLICTELPAADVLLRHEQQRSWPYWLGAFISDGATSNHQYMLFFGTAKNKRPKTLAWQFAKFAWQRGWGARRPREEKDNLVAVKAGTTAVGRQRFREDMANWGYDRDWTAHFKRVPEAIYTAGLWGIRQFLWGMLEADGTQSSCRAGSGRTVPHDIYNFHMCNLPLLQDLQELCSYVGVKSGIVGPYKPSRNKPWVSWRLDMHPYDVETVLVGSRAKRSRSRVSRQPLAPRESCAAFLAAVPSNPYARGSSNALYHRLATGGSVSPWTLRELYRRACAPHPPIYDTVAVKGIEPLYEKAPVYTLSVADPLHRYLAQGTVTKNCLGAEIATSNMVYIQDELRRRFKNAHIIKHGHDEVLIEADEKDAEAISEIVKRLFGSTVLEGPAGPVTLTAGLNIGKSMKDVK